MNPREYIAADLSRESAALEESPQELARLVEDAAAFKLALSLLSPEEGPSRGLRLLQKAYQAICDRAECSEREADWLRKELADLKQAEKRA